MCYCYCLFVTYGLFVTLIAYLSLLLLTWRLYWLCRLYFFFATFAAYLSLWLFISHSYCLFVDLTDFVDFSLCVTFTAYLALVLLTCHSYCLLLDFHLLMLLLIFYVYCLFVTMLLTCSFADLVDLDFWIGFGYFIVVVVQKSKHSYQINWVALLLNFRKVQSFRSSILRYHLNVEAYW